MVTAMAKMSDRGHGQDPQQHTNGLNRSPSLCTPGSLYGQGGVPLCKRKFGDPRAERASERLSELARGARPYGDAS